MVSDTSGDVGGWPATIVTMAHVARNQLEYILDVDGIRVRAHGHMRESRNLIPGGLVKVIVSPEAICIWPHSADDDIGNGDKGHLGELVPA